MPSRSAVASRNVPAHDPAHALDDPSPLRSTPRRSSAARPRTSAVMARELGLPVPPGFVDHDRDVPGVPGEWLAGRPRRGAARPDAELEAAVGRRLRRRRGPVARQRPVRGAGLDARDDGHDPGPRPQRRHDGRSGPRCAATRRSPDTAASASRPASGRSSASDDVPDGPVAPAAPRDRGRLPVLEQRPGTGLSPEGGHRRRPRDRGDRPGDGLRQPRSDSATGVLFTRNPATGEPTLYGDILFDAQGEDVVAGTHQTEPIAVLDERMPAVAAELAARADRLERHYADLCDIEFTIEDGRLWMLQVRVGKRSPQAALRIAVDMAEDETFPLSRAEAVERVAPLLADPPTIATSRQQPSPAAGDRPAGLARDRERPDRHAPRRPPWRPPTQGGRRSSSGPRPRPTTSTGWPARPGS